MYFYAILIICATWYFISWYKWKKTVLDFIEKLPGVPRIPIIGTDYIFIGVAKTDIFDLIRKHLRMFGPAPFRTWNGSKPGVHLTIPEHLEIIMSSSVHITKSHQYELVHPWLGQGLLTSTGSRWHQHRKLITPTFHFKILENFMHVIEEKTQILLDILHKKTDGKPHNIYRDITHCALDIICETAMGVNVNAMLNTENEYIQAIHTMGEIIPWKMVRPYIPEFIFNILPQGYKFQHALNVLHGFSENIISLRKKLLQTKSSRGEKESNDVDELLGQKRRLSLLDMLLDASEDGKILTDTDIREEVDTFVFEGHDTTTSSISWTLLLLGNHPEIQEKLYQEVKDVLQEKSIPSFNDFAELKYLECVIKESLRMYPSVPFVIRTIEEEVQIDEYKIPAGTHIILHIYGVHNCPEYYPDPNRFDPDRFLPENFVGRHPYSYIPFSAGPRNCIGQKFAMYEEKTILASIIKRYKVTAIEKIGDIKIIPDIVLRPINGVLVTLERRE